MDLPVKNNANYGTEQIKTLEGIEAIRLRAGMYIGSTGPEGVKQITLEIISNAVDEYLNGYCTKCDMPLWDTFTTSIIAAVVNEKNEIALLKQNYVSETKYVLVAGIMKISESAEETAIREIKEEIGQKVNSLEFIKTYPYDKKEMLMIGFKANVTKAELNLSKEVDAAEWVELNKALALLREGSIGWQLVKEVIEKFS